MKENTQLKSYLKNLLGCETESFLTARAESRTVRVNPIKTIPRMFEKWAKQHNLDFDKIPFSPTGYIINDDYLPLSHTLSFFKGDFQYQGI